jgi:hypothetical protein
MEAKMRRITLAISLALSCILISATVGVAADIGLKEIGGELALVMPEGDADTTFGLGVVADLGTIIPELRAEASAEYWGDSWEVLGYEWSWSAISIGGTAKYYFPMSGNMSLFAGGGSTSDSDMDIGFHLIGGVDIPISPTMKLSPRLKYAIDGTDALWVTGALSFRLH